MAFFLTSGMLNTTFVLELADCGDKRKGGGLFVAILHIH